MKTPTSIFKADVKNLLISIPKQLFDIVVIFFYK